MSFWSVLSNIRENLQNKFETNASKGVNDPDEGQQAEHDAQKGGEDTSSTSRDGANDEIQKHDPAWKAVKDLSDKAIETVPKVEAAAKLGWLKFVGGITALFVFVTAYSFHNNLGGPTPEQIRMYNNERTIIMQGEQIRQMERIMVSEDEFQMATANLFVAPAPVIPDAPVAAAAALPPPIAAVAEQPVQVVETDSNGGVEAVTTTTVGHAYQSVPRAAQRQMEDNPPPKIEHDYDKPSTKNCYRDDCLGAIDKQFGQKSASFTSGDGSMSITVNSPNR